MATNVNTDHIMVTFPNGETDTLTGFINGSTDPEPFDEELGALKDGFDFYDRDNSREVTRSEINDILRAKGLI